jgi:uncharacterized protein (TIGR03083 family)
VDPATRLRVQDAIDEVAEQVISLLRTIPDARRQVPNCPGWTVADVIAHLVTVTPRYEAGPQGGGDWVDTPAQLPALNAQQMQRVATREVDELAAQLLAALRSLRTTIDSFGDPAPTFHFHGGEVVDANAALGILLGELIVHGYDIASSVGSPWPIVASHVSIVVDGINPILPGWLDVRRSAGHNATYELRLRGQATHVYAFSDGILQVNPPEPPPIDVHISGDPAATLLVIYKRRSRWPSILTGKLLAWGRRPWLALTFGSRIHRP